MEAIGRQVPDGVRLGKPEWLDGAVRQYLDFVYATAYREMRDAHRAEDVTQAVFFILAQKGVWVEETALAGWLFRTTRYAAANARRILARQRYHERHAARREVQMMTQGMEEQEAAGQLNEALSDLRAPDRDVLLLRYLQGRSVKEASAALGVSEHAVRKREERALERLRKFFWRRGIAATPALIPQVLTTSLSQAAPAGLRTAMLSGSVGPSASSLAIAQGAMKMALLAKIQLMAAAIGVVVVMGVGAGLVARSVAPHRSESLATAVPAAASVDAIDEASVPGRTFVVVSDLLVDADGAQAFLKVTQPIAGKGQGSFYELHGGKAHDIRAVLADLQATGGFLKISPQLLHASRGPEGEGLATSQQRYFVVPQGNKRVMAQLDFPPVYLKTEDTPQGAKVTIDFEKQAARLTLIPNQGGPLEKQATVHFDGTLAPGNMLLMVGDFGDWQEGHYVSVRLVEAYKASDLEQRFISQNANVDGAEYPMLDGGQWLMGGPAAARRYADRLTVWAAQSAAPPAASGKWIQRLSDGTTVELRSVATPATFPLCWDAEGRSLPFIGREGAAGVLKNQRKRISTGPGARFAVTNILMPTFEPAPADLAVSLYIHSPLPRTEQWSELWSGDTEKVVLDELDSVTVYVGVGPWQEQTLELGGLVKIGDVTIKAEATPARTPTMPGGGEGQVLPDLPPEIDFTADHALTLDTEIVCGVVTKDHRLVKGGLAARAMTMAQWQRLGMGNRTQVPLDLIMVRPEDQVDHLVVLSRPREKVTFEGFVHEPRPDLAGQVTADEVRVASERLVKAEQEQRALCWARQWKERQADLTALDAIPRDAATPAGAMRIMVDRAMAGDAKAVQEWIVGSDERVRMLANMLAAHGRALSLCEKTFGAAAFQGETETVGMYHHLIALPGESFLINAWIVHGDYAYSQVGGQVLVFRDGKWRLDADRGPPVSEQLQTPWDEVVDGVRTGKIKTAAEAARRLAGVVALGFE